MAGWSEDGVNQGSVLKNVFCFVPIVCFEKVDLEQGWRLLPCSSQPARGGLLIETRRWSNCVLKNSKHKNLDENVRGGLGNQPIQKIG